MWMNELKWNMHRKRTLKYVLFMRTNVHAVGIEQAKESAGIKTSIWFATALENAPNTHRATQSFLYNVQMLIR